MAELHDLTALEQGRAIAAGEVSALELTDHYLARSEALGDDVGAFVRLLPELARDQARAADDAVRAGGVPAQSPLFGVVCPVKDLDVIAGVPTSFGNPDLNVVFDVDSNVVTALRAGGLVFTGKTNTPEFGLPCYTEPDGRRPARTPWDLNRSASGSSGGAAGAVAAGLAPVAQGSDGGGSVRLPSAVCGLVGIKPSRGRVSTGPYDYSVGDLTVMGPLARNVRDAAALLDVMSAFHAVGEPYRAMPVHGTFLAAADRPAPTLRIGYYTQPVIGVTEPSAPVVTAVQDTVALLVELGHEVVEIAPPLGHDAVPLFETLWAGLADSQDFPPAVMASFTPLTRYLRGRAAGRTAGDLAAAVAAIRRKARDSMIASEDFDVVLSPTAADVPFRVGSMRDDADPAADFEAQKQWASYTAVYNVTGQPSINLPLNWTPDGLPVGVQFAGRRDDEALLITLSAQLEEARPWHARRPGLW
ncbi:MAG: amidase [Actinomycetota bacterium]|nr:amidase [Actinomycetota bacterium]